MLYQYDPGLIIVSFKGVRLLGPAEGTFVTAERAEDAFTSQVGSAGDVTRSRNRNKMGSVTYTCQQGSPSNDVLSALQAADELTGLGFGSLMVKDLIGTTLVEAPSAWIKKIANPEFAKEAGPRAWVFDCAQLYIYTGGALIITP